MRGFYFEKEQPHILLLPTIAISSKGEFWIGIGWLSFEFGWRAGE